MAADDVQHTCVNFQVATLSLWVDKQPCNQCSPTLPAFQRSKLCEGAPLVILKEAIYLFKWRPSAVGEKLSDCSLKVSQPIWGCSLSHAANYHSDNESWSNITNLPVFVLKVTPAVYIHESIKEDATTAGNSSSSTLSLSDNYSDSIDGLYIHWAPSLLHSCSLMCNRYMFINTTLKPWKRQMALGCVQQECMEEKSIIAQSNYGGMLLIVTVSLDASPY